MTGGTPSPTAFRIRPAAPGDVAPVRRLLEDGGLPNAGIEDQFDGGGWAVAVSGATVVGVEAVETYEGVGLLRSAVVSEAWRGRGIGEALTRDRIAWARRRGLRGLYLLTTTAGDWFPRFGFSVASRDGAPESIRASREFAEACPASATCMYLDLQMETR